MRLPERPIIAILALAAAARAVGLVAFRADVYWGTLLHDARRYHDWAAAWATGTTFEPGAFHQAPLYPWLLSLLYRVAGPDPGGAYLVQCALGIVTLFLVSRVAARAYGEEAGILAAAIGALYGTLNFYELKLLPAALTVFLAALLIDRLQAADASRIDRGWVVAGVVTGLAVVANPGFLLAGGLAAAWILLDRARPLRSRALRLAAFAIGAIVVIAPVSVRNRNVGGAWVLVSTNAGITFYQGNNPNAVGVFANPDGFTGSIATQRVESRSLAEAESGRPLGDGEVSGFWFRKGLTWLASDPASSFALLARKLLLALASEEQPLEYDPRIDGNPVRWIAPLPFAALFGLALARWVRPRERAPVLPREAGRAEGPILILLATQLALVVTFFVAARYRLPAIPALAAMAGAGGAGLVARFRAAPAGAVRPAALAAGVALLSLLYVPVAQGELRRRQEAMGWADRGGALRAAGRLADSEEAYRRSIALDPSYPYAHLDLGKSLRAAGRREAAIDAAREAVRIAPSLAEARFDLGVLLFEEERLEEAEGAFAEAVRLAPEDARAANNLMGTQMRLGRADAALATHGAMRARGIDVDPPLDRWARERGR